jgi:low affinity Fe/Cu permease
MKTLKIYSALSTIAIITLFVFLYQNNTKLSNFEEQLKQKETELEQKANELIETEEILEQCSDRYYKEIEK